MLIEHREGLKAIDQPARTALATHFDAMAPQRERFCRRNRYYYSQLVKHLRFIIPPGRSVLAVGCHDGRVLEALEPALGVGIDVSSKMIELARARAQAAGKSNLEFHQADVEAVRFDRTFDFIVLSDVLGDTIDIQLALENLRSACGPQTRIIAQYHSILWDPVLKLGERLGAKMPQLRHNWITRKDLDAFLALTDYELVQYNRTTLWPRHTLGLGPLCNRFLAPLPGLRRCCLTQMAVFRRRLSAPTIEQSVTVLIPCRNERGNIRDAIARLPSFGSHQEIIFVDGHSTDGTVAEIEAVTRQCPGKDIKLIHQEGRGKGDAVRLGFAQAGGDVLMILDADLTVPPEDLPKFYEAIASDRAEFINGSRMVYPLEKQAMRFLNNIGNHFFGSALSSIIGQPLRDTLCGTKVLTRENYQRIVEGRAAFGHFDPFGDFDLIFGAARLGLKILEVPVRYRARAYGTTNISRFRHGWLLLRMTLFAYRKFKLR